MGGSEGTTKQGMAHVRFMGKLHPIVRRFIQQSKFLSPCSTTSVRASRGTPPECKPVVSRSMAIHHKSRQQWVNKNLNIPRPVITTNCSAAWEACGTCTRVGERVNGVGHDGKRTKSDEAGGGGGGVRVKNYVAE